LHIQRLALLNSKECDCRLAPASASCSSGAAFLTYPYLLPRLCPVRTIVSEGGGSSFGVSRDTLERRFSIGSFSARSKNESRRRVETSATAQADTLPSESVAVLGKETINELR
jgi:hypothetical protein